MSPAAPQGPDDGRTDDGRGDGGWGDPPWGSGHPPEELVDGLLDTDLAPLPDAAPAGPQGSRGLRAAAELVARWRAGAGAGDDPRTGPGRRAGAVEVPVEVLAAAHVLDCARCRDVLDGMRAVRALLRSQAVSVPPPPADLHERIAAALDEAGVRHRALGRRRRRRRALALAAGVVVVAGAGAGAAGLLAGPARPVPVTAAGGGTSRPASTAGGGSTATTTTAPTRKATATGVAVLATGTDYGSSDLAPQVLALLRVEDARGAGGPTSVSDRGTAEPSGAPPAGPQEDGGGSRVASAPLSSGPLAQPSSLQDCLDALDRRGRAPLAVDESSWQGRSAAVIVLPAPHGDATASGSTSGSSAATSRVEVWVVRAGCDDGFSGLMHYEVMTAPAG